MDKEGDNIHDNHSPFSSYQEIDVDKITSKVCSGAKANEQKDSDSQTAEKKLDSNTFAIIQSDASGSSVIMNIETSNKDPEKETEKPPSETENQKYTTEELKIRRREANRISAQKSRRRKKIMLDALEEQLKKLQTENSQLKKTRDERKQEIQDRYSRLQAQASLESFKASVNGTMLQQYYSRPQERNASMMMGSPQDPSLLISSSNIRKQPVCMNHAARLLSNQVSIDQGNVFHSMLLHPSLNTNMSLRQEPTLLVQSPAGIIHPVSANMSLRQNPTLLAQSPPGIIHPVSVSEISMQQLYQQHK